MTILFLRGLVLGLSIAAPVGPIGVLCIRRTLVGGRKVDPASGLGIAEAGADYVRAGALVAGVFGGSALWWLLLSDGVSLFRARFTPGALRWVNRISGLVIAGFGTAALWGAVRDLLR